MKRNVQSYVKFYFDKWSTHVWRALLLPNFTTFLGISVYLEKYKVFIIRNT